MLYTFANDRDVEPTLFRILVEQAPDAIVFFDPQGTIRVWNQKASELFGYVAKEIPGKSFGILARGDYDDQRWQGIYDAILLQHTTSGTKPIATRAWRKSGGTFYVDVAFSMVHDELARVVGFVASARDITGHYLAQRSAMQAEAELHGNIPQLAANTVAPAKSITPFLLD